MYSQLCLLCHISLHVLISANCGAFRRLFMQSLKVPACLFYFLFFPPAARLRSTALTTAGAVCMGVCVCVRVCKRVCVLCFEAITVAACDVAVTECVFLVFRPAVLVC